MANKQFNILQICSARQTGGGERHLADLSNSLADRGHNVYAAVVPASPLIPALHRLPREHVFELRMSNSLDLFAAQKLAEIVRKCEIDIIHAHVARDYMLAVFAAARSANTPFVLTRHVLFPLKKFHKKTLGRAARIIAVSNAVAGSLKSQNIVAADKIITIHNGIDAKVFRGRPGKNGPSQALNKVKAPLLVGMIGHIAPIKGQDVFVHAAAIIARHRADVDFVIVGEDKSRRGENRKAIERLISDLGLGNRCHLIGWQDDVGQLLPDLDIFVSPSRSEPFGLVILEAMASGVPVVASASEGAAEIIDDGITGKLVPVGDPELLALAISDLLNDPSKRQRLAGNGLETVQDRFSLAQMVDAVESLYDEVLIEREAKTTTTAS